MAANWRNLDAKRYSNRDDPRDMSDLEKSNVPTRLYGGQAIIEGVMIRGARSCAVSVRRADGSIHQENIPLLSWANGKLRRVPFVRGILVLIETL